MKNLKLKIKDKKNSGFVILFTVLVASIILLIAIGISNIAYREILLTREAREGAFAFYAADTGAECGLYIDKLAGSGSCAGQAVNALSFTLDLNGGTNCAAVTIAKGVPSASGLYTRIESLGYNVSCADALSTPPPAKKVERAIRVTYYE